jgi:hypothetical protein
MKNPHAVALGRLGGAKGGKARAEALSATRRRAIARIGGAARGRSLSSAQRKEAARLAAIARWSRTAQITTAVEAPVAVRRLLKSYDPAALRWANSDDRYAVVKEIVIKGDDEAKRWLRGNLRRDQVRELLRTYAGTGCNEADRRKLRKAYRISTVDIPVRPFLGFRRRRQST